MQIFCCFIVFLCQYIHSFTVPEMAGRGGYSPPSHPPKSATGNSYLLATLENYAEVLVHNFKSDGKIRQIYSANMSFATNLLNFFASKASLCTALVHSCHASLKPGSEGALVAALFVKGLHVLMFYHLIIRHCVTLVSKLKNC